MAEKELTRGRGRDMGPRRQARRGGRMSPFEEMERMLEDLLPSPVGAFGGGWPNWARVPAPFEGGTPRVDVIDRDDELVVHAELPGVRKEDIDVSLSDGALRISATTKREEEGGEGDYHRREISRGEFRRTIPLTESVDAERAKAKLEDGILELTLPKTEGGKRRSIDVE